MHIQVVFNLKKKKRFFSQTASDTHSSIELLEKGGKEYLTGS